MSPQVTEGTRLVVCILLMLMLSELLLHLQESLLLHTQHDPGFLRCLVLFAQKLLAAVVVGRSFI